MSANLKSKFVDSVDLNASRFIMIIQMCRLDIVQYIEYYYILLGNDLRHQHINSIKCAIQFCLNAN